jgi:hypothetical protein
MSRFACLPCIGGDHGPDCLGCACRCRAILGLDLFEHGDPTAPGNYDVPDPDEDWVA